MEVFYATLRPPHRLVLKVGMPIMLLRNMNKLSGMANGTVLTVLRLLPNVIHAEIQSGVAKGNVRESLVDLS